MFFVIKLSKHCTIYFFSPSSLLSVTKGACYGNISNRCTCIISYKRVDNRMTKSQIQILSINYSFIIPALKYHLNILRGQSNNRGLTTVRLVMRIVFWLLFDILGFTWFTTEHFSTIVTFMLHLYQSSNQYIGWFYFILFYFFSSKEVCFAPYWKVKWQRIC